MFLKQAFELYQCNLNSQQTAHHRQHSMADGTIRNQLIVRYLAGVLKVRFGALAGISK
jgi:hypothetical protein